MNRIYYHGSDFDGKASGAIIYDALNGEGELKGLDYGNFQFEDLLNSWNPEDKVYLADFSFKGDQMAKAKEKLGDNFTFIDHHKTAIDEVKEMGIKGLTRVGTAACRLCWEYFHPDTPEPKIITLLGRYDVFDLDPEVETFQLGFGLYDSEPSSPNWKTFFKSPPELVKDICGKGEVIKKYTDNDFAEYAKKNAFERDLFGYKALVLNSGPSSKRFDSMFDENKHQIMVAFRKTNEGNKWSVSFYCRDSGIDVSEIAKKLGGGGHAKASGAVLETKALMELLDI